MSRVTRLEVIFGGRVCRVSIIRRYLHCLEQVLAGLVALVIKGLLHWAHTAWTGGSDLCAVEQAIEQKRILESCGLNGLPHWPQIAGGSILVLEWHAREQKRVSFL